MILGALLVGAVALGCDGGPPATGPAVARSDSPAVVASQPTLGRGAGCGKPLPAAQPMTVPGTPKGYLQ